MGCDEQPLAILVGLTKPLGLLLGDSPSSGGGLIIDEVLEGGSAIQCGKLHVGDLLVAAGERSLRGCSYDEAMAILKSVGGGSDKIDYLFERKCRPLANGSSDATAEATVRGAESTETDLSPGQASPVVVDSGTFTSIGGRAQMEDTCILTSLALKDGTGSAQSYILAAVCDGHRGCAAARHACGTIASAAANAIAAGEPSALSVAWRDTVDQYLRTGAQDGTTISAVLLSNRGTIEILNCGDSRTVIASRSTTESPSPAPQIIFATIDHAASSEKEAARIRASGGSVDCSPGGTFRVGVAAPSIGPDAVFRVAVARALGGSEWLAGRISNAADVAMIRLPPNACFAILATDGLWGVLDEVGGSLEAANLVLSARVAGLNAGQAAQQLGALAKRLGSDDNCAVVVIYFGEP